MSGSLPRHLLKWLLGLDLSSPAKNLKRDFSNGFLVAEICCRYLPSDFGLYSYEKVESAQRKADNWRLLERQFKKLGVPVTAQQCADVRGGTSEAAVQDFLQSLYDHFEQQAPSISNSDQPATHEVQILDLSSPEPEPEPLPPPSRAQPASPAQAGPSSQGRRVVKSPLPRFSSKPPMQLKAVADPCSSLQADDGRPCTRGDKVATAGSQPADIIDHSFDPLAFMADQQAQKTPSPSSRPPWKQSGKNKAGRQNRADTQQLQIHRRVSTANGQPAAAAAANAVSTAVDEPSAAPAKPGSRKPVSRSNSRKQPTSAAAALAQMGVTNHIDAIMSKLLATDQQLAGLKQGKNAQQPNSPPLRQSRASKDRMVGFLKEEAPPPPPSPPPEPAPPPKPLKPTPVLPAWKAYDREIPKPTVPRKKVSRPTHFPVQQTPAQPEQQQQQQVPAAPAEPATEAVCSATADEMSTAGQFADLRAPQVDAEAAENGSADASGSGKATAAPAAAPEGPCLEYDLQRRPVEWKPYPPSSYLGTDLDPKSAKYWRLGGLGKDENEHWQAKIQVAEQLKGISENIRAFNLAKAPKAAAPAAKPLSSNERAKLFAKNVPKPRIVDYPPVTQESQESVAMQQVRTIGTLPPHTSAELRKLEQQHVMDQRTVQHIRSMHSTTVS